MSVLSPTQFVQFEGATTNLFLKVKRRFRCLSFHSRLRCCRCAFHRHVSPLSLGSSFKIVQGADGWAQRHVHPPVRLQLLSSGIVTELFLMTELRTVACCKCCSTFFESLSLQLHCLSHAGQRGLQPKTFLDAARQRSSWAIFTVNDDHARFARCDRAQPCQQILLPGREFARSAGPR
jgi:hypothetical protein